MTSVLDIRQLSAGYRRSVVVRDLDLRVEPGEIVALLGPNGAGKTTTLRAVSGLVRTFAGKVSLGDQDLSAATPTERAGRGIAHVPEDRGLFSGLTVAEHFRLGRRREHIDADLAYSYFPALAHLSNRRAGLLSGGEQQMLAMGRALARRPDLLLLDELSLGLAPVMVQRLLPVLRAFADATRCGILLVEQHVQLALGVVDRAYLMAHGEISDSYQAADLRSDRDLVRASYLGGGRWAPARPGNPSRNDSKGVQ
jgi:branched-chain amino acid transport system ATP-binding protein